MNEKENSPEYLLRNDCSNINVKLGKKPFYTGRDKGLTFIGRISGNYEKTAETSKDENILHFTAFGSLSDGVIKDIAYTYLELRYIYAYQRHFLLRYGTENQLVELFKKFYKNINEYAFWTLSDSYEKYSIYLYSSLNEPIAVICRISPMGLEIDLYRNHNWTYKK